MRVDSSDASALRESPGREGERRRSVDVFIERLLPAAGRTLLLAALVLGGLSSGSAFGKAAAVRGASRAPNEIRIAVPAMQRTIVFSDPAYLSTRAEDTPYQRLKLCDEVGKDCRTLLDVRGTGGVAMPVDSTLGLSPDGRFLLAFRMTGVDAAGKRYRSQYDELYDLVAGRRVSFSTAAGLTATSDNIQGWSATRPHALEVSAGVGKTDLAWPPGEN